MASTLYAPQALIRFCCEDLVLLEYQSAVAPIDPGHWRMPILDLTDPTPPLAHPKLCGLPVNLANAVRTQLSSLGLSLCDVQSISQAGEVQSPPWHPRPERLQICDVRMNHAATGSDAQAATHQWRPINQWLQMFSAATLLVNPLSRAILDEWPRIPDWSSWHSEEPTAGLKIIPVRSHTLPPASHTNAFLLGDDLKVLIDPSPTNEQAYSELLESLQSVALSKIVISHHHPDHHQQVPRLARELQVPVLCSADTLARIPRRFGRAYLQDVFTGTLKNGDVVTQSLGVDVRAYAVPGHDAGQLAFAPDSMNWMIVGDLIQGIGTVVIAEPEGDMAAYFESLRWVIEKNPKVIIPSHGQAMGSCFRIEETLRHRLQREADVLALHGAGLNIEDMLEQLYANVDRRLWGLARMNIQSHLTKLRNEGRIKS